MQRVTVAIGALAMLGALAGESAAQSLSSNAIMGRW